MNYDIIRYIQEPCMRMRLPNEALLTALVERLECAHWSRTSKYRLNKPKVLIWAFVKNQLYSNAGNKSKKYNNHFYTTANGTRILLTISAKRTYNLPVGDTVICQLSINLTEVVLHAAGGAKMREKEIL